MVKKVVWPSESEGDINAVSEYIVKDQDFNFEFSSWKKRFEKVIG
jgi:hypothetical protein